MTDRNWGLFAVIPRDNAKPEKKPMNLATGHFPVAPEQAFNFSLEEATAKLNGDSTMLGYGAGTSTDRRREGRSTRHRHARA